MKKKLLLGLMAMTLPLTTWAQEGDFKITLSGKTFEYNGGDSKPTVGVTDAAGGEMLATQYKVTYTLSNGNVTDEPVDYEEIKDAGIYTVKVEGNGTLADKLTPSTTTFTITPKPLTSVSFSSITKVYGSDDINFVAGDIKGLVSDAQAEKDNAVKCLTVKLQEGQSAVNAGDKAKVTVEGIEATAATTKSNYSYTAPVSGDVTYELEVTKRPLTVSLDEAKTTYTGAAIKLADILSKKEYSFGKDEIINNDEVTILLAGAGNVDGYTKAGTYNVTVTLPETDVNKNYYIANEGGVAKFTIERAKMTISLKNDYKEDGITVTYGSDNDLTKMFDFEDWAAQEPEDEKAKFAMKANFTTTSSIGEYPVALYYGGSLVNIEDNELNYDITYNTVQATVEAASIKGAKIELANTTYQGKAFDPTKTYTVGEGEGAVEKPIITVTLSEKELTLGTDYEVGAIAAVNAEETFTVTITGINNYQDSETSAEQTIERAELTIAPKEDAVLESVYTGKAIAQVTDLFDVEGLVTPEGGEKETLKGIGDLTMRMITTERTNAGTYSVWVYGNGSRIDPKNYATAFKNYSVSYEETAKYTIKKKPATYYIKGTEMTYNGKVAGTTDLTIAFDEENGLVDADKEKDLTEIFEDGHTPIIGFEDGVAPKNANAEGYALTLLNTDENKVSAKNYELTYDAEQNGKYVIEQAAMDIQIQDKAKSIEFGSVVDGELTDEILETWRKGKAEYVKIGMDTKNITGYQADADMARTMMTFELREGAQSGKSGFYEGGLKVYVEKDENWTPAQNLVWQNYKITEDIADLTIGDVEIVGGLVLDGSEGFVTEGDEETEDTEEPETTELTVAQKLEKYNGATVKEVKVVNLVNYAGYIDENGKKHYAEATQNFEPKKWYTLVLPFSIEPKELSDQLGYALVYVPNEVKTKVVNGTSEVYFSVTMDEIPANTMMLFRATSFKDMEEGLTFESKEIVNLTEEEKEGIVINDGIKYVPVYGKTYLEGTDLSEWYLWPETGKFADVKTLFDLVNVTGVTEFAVYPFNGYIKQPVNVSEARFFIEDIDGSTTEINAITGEAISNAAEGWYTVGGVKLNAQPTQKGVYINNGQKVVIK